MSNAATFTPHPELPPPVSEVGAIGWVRKNLLGSPLNVILTAFALYILWITLIPAVQWGILTADFTGTSQDACTSGGACWVFVSSRITFFIYGFYPEAEYWRVDLVWLMLAACFLPQFLPGIPKVKKWLGIASVTALPVIGAYLMIGGPGLEFVETNKWGGLTVNVVLAFVGIVASLPIGVALALGRRSQMPIIKTMCICFIEFWRGVPLITVLFMASVMLPLFMPEGVDFDKLMRALVGITLFQSAYMAEVIRGGLQAIPKGQYEAADALGLSYWKKMGLIILPQALKLVIPGIVNTFIALFKDTTLVLIIGILDILAGMQAAITDPAWRNVATEGYLFVAFCFWIFCFGMSRYSIALEKKLQTGHKR